MMRDQDRSVANGGVLTWSHLVDAELAHYRSYTALPDWLRPSFMRGYRSDHEFARTLMSLASWRGGGDLDRWQQRGDLMAERSEKLALHLLPNDSGYTENTLAVVGHTTLATIVAAETLRLQTAPPVGESIAALMGHLWLKGRRPGDEQPGPGSAAVREALNLSRLARSYGDDTLKGLSELARLGRLTEGGQVAAGRRAFLEAMTNWAIAQRPRLTAADRDERHPLRVATSHVLTGLEGMMRGRWPADPAEAGSEPAGS